MSRRCYRQDYEKSLNKDITVGFLLPTGATLSRNQRFFQTSPWLNKLRAIFFPSPEYFN